MKSHDENIWMLVCLFGLFSNWETLPERSCSVISRQKENSSSCCTVTPGLLQTARPCLLASAKFPVAGFQFKQTAARALTPKTITHSAPPSLRLPLPLLMCALCEVSDDLWRCVNCLLIAAFVISVLLYWWITVLIKDSWEPEVTNGRNLVITHSTGRLKGNCAFLLLLLPVN